MLDPATPVIIVTGNNYEEEMRHCAPEQSRMVYYQPYNKKQILEGIDRYVGKYQGAQWLKEGWCNGGVHQLISIIEEITRRRCGDGGRAF